MMNAMTTKGAVVWMMLMSPLLIQPTQSTQAEDSHVKGTMIVTPKEDLGVPRATLAGLAAGAAEDTFKACRARIPEVASVGQFMLAEQSCAGEEEIRNAIRSAPKF